MLKFFIFVIIFLFISDNVNPYFDDFYGHEISYLRNKYNWYSDRIYFLVRKYCEVNHRIVFSLIHVESSGRQFAVSRYVKVYVIRNNKKILEKHRAIGLMQVVSFYYKEKDLFDLEKNIFFGCKVLNDCFKKYKSFVKSISCYNMGINSRKVNYRYVSKILDNI
ncbi:MAG: hypothetical protein KatS3mg068_1531 [Candidatus Sericytochromatia bacterium]|nr:MAG: hypothetical protein KatS3mg068_1531 [Candidatus Sericytochromatia bacterium]